MKRGQRADGKLNNRTNTGNAEWQALSDTAPVRILTQPKAEKIRLTRDDVWAVRGHFTYPDSVEDGRSS